MISSQKKSIYPIDKWKIIEEEFDVETNFRDETIFTLANGYIGMRGTFEEGYMGPSGTSMEGTYINGFYESTPIKYGEEAYGYARNSHTMLNIVNSKAIKLAIDGESFNLFNGKIHRYRRELNMKNGILTREILWESPKGRIVEIIIKRLVSLTNKHLVVLSYEVRAINFTGEVSIISSLDGDVKNQEGKKDPRIGSELQGTNLITIDRGTQEDFGFLLQQTRNTKQTLFCAMENHLISKENFIVEGIVKEDGIDIIYKGNIQQEETIKLVKYTYYTTDSLGEGKEKHLHRDTLLRVKEEGFNKLEDEQIQFLHSFWQDSDIEIVGDDMLQQGIRFNIFHLLQSVGRDGRTNIAAKGLTGEGYGGHYFWDTEIYIIPFFLHTNPMIARKLLEFRFNILDKARERARTMNHKKGALFPWRTIAGDELSAYYPAGTAQYHINADIAYAIKKYVETTGDIEFLLDYGAEMVLESARIWIDLGIYSPNKDNRFCIHEVTGPDEYTAMVSNNFYTNAMAQNHLDYAYDIAVYLKENYQERYSEISSLIGLDEEEIYQWKRASENMYLPYDNKLEIRPQDDSFLEKKPWDFQNVPRDKYPLLLHFHPLVIYRHQVCKQADVILALFLLGNKYDRDEKKKNYDYYEPITTHDSSLSSSIFSIMASEVEYKEKAYEYFMETARMDLDDNHNNAHYGVHTAAMAGTWMAVVHGFAGMRNYDGDIYFKPHLPKQLEGFKFKVKIKNCQLEVEVSSDQVIYRLLKGSNLKFYHGKKQLEINKEEEKRERL